MNYLAKTLQSHPKSSSLHVLVPTSNTGHFTYDGIETCAERATDEIQKYIASPAGASLQKISVIGYSLGGLVARYCVGLLFAAGIFDRIQPLNFTTFATPHVGVRTPLGPFPGSFPQTIFNALGPRTLSVSGRQMWMIDSFRNTKRPLLVIMADQASIFIQGLKAFKNRSLYANCINDRSVSFYTAMIWKVDPFRDLDSVDVNYLKGWKPLIVDPENPVTPKRKPEHELSFLTAISTKTWTILKNAPLVGAVAVLIPIGSTIYLINSGIQAVRSNQRIRLHEAGKAGIELSRYRIPLMIEEARNTLGAALSRTNTRDGVVQIPDDQSTSQFQEASDEKTCTPSHEITPSAGPTNKSNSPILALTPTQFEIIDSLNQLSWRKFPVHIQKVRHTHAAIVVRMEDKWRGFDEGRHVARHWIDEVFEV